MGSKKRSWCHYRRYLSTVNDERSLPIIVNGVKQKMMETMGDDDEDDSVTSLPEQNTQYCKH